MKIHSLKTIAQHSKPFDSGGYEVVWPMREIYHTDGPAANVTEIQFPIHKT
ncbi:MAG TPA: hypothetical protein VGV35_03135 [Bryobacteraceae bacterium]|nr:hypothetical protein [Bryobacteraceae bacterium]